MAKSKNHTAHNQSFNAHRNGIQKPKRQRQASEMTKGGFLILLPGNFNRELVAPSKCTKNILEVQPSSSIEFDRGLFQNLQTGRFFDVMNPDGSGNDRFTSIISTVTFNFMTLFAKTYPNCTAFNIRDFDYRFVPVPMSHFRYDTGVFLLQILKTYRGMGVPGFSSIS